MTVDKNDLPVETNEESQAKKIKYPRAIPFIVINEFCERFNYYGMRTILALYIVRKLEYSEDTATFIFHIFTTMVYFFCIFGSVIADSWWGKFKTILILSLVYMTGSVVITLGAIDPWNMPQVTFTFLGLSLIAFGSGGIKPCVSVFGGDQFRLPEQAKQLAWFFSLFYFAVNSGSFISTLITPILRETQCFGEEDCFSLGFFVPAVLMAASIVIFVAGKPLYTMKPLAGNMLVKVTGCVWTGARLSFKNKKTNPKEHWLDHAEPEYGRRLVDDIKVLLNVLVLYIPLPIFWTLFDQQGSRWTFQATRMDGDIGFYYIKPDQAQVINPLLILVFIPLYEVAFYPLLNLVGIRRPLQKLALGGILAGVAFFVSFLLEFQIMKTSAVIPKDYEAHLRVFNTMPCDFNIRVNGSEAFLLKSLQVYENKDIITPLKDPEDIVSLPYTLTATGSGGCSDKSGNFFVSSATSSSYQIFGQDPANYNIKDFDQIPDKSKNGTNFINVLTNFATTQQILIMDKDRTYMDQPSTNTNKTWVPKGKYLLYVGTNVIGEEFELKTGGVYTITLLQTGNNYRREIIEITPANGVSTLWIIPQYVVMTLGEVMYSVTGLSYSFEQSPASMKSVLTGCWMLTIAVGNLIIAIIAEARMFDEQVWEFLMFAILMWVDMAIFAFLAWRFKPIPIKTDEDYERERLEEEAIAQEGQSNLPKLIPAIASAPEKTEL